MSRIKKIYKFIVNSAKLLTVISFFIIGVLVMIVGAYIQGQMDACNSMLRRDKLDTQLYGLYCERRIDGIVVRSSVLKKTMFNITTDKVLMNMKD